MEDILKQHSSNAITPTMRGKRQLNNHREVEAVHQALQGLPVVVAEQRLTTRDAVANRTVVVRHPVIIGLVVAYTTNLNLYL